MLRRRGTARRHLRAADPDQTEPSDSELLHNHPAITPTPTPTTSAPTTPAPTRAPTSAPTRNAGPAGGTTPSDAGGSPSTKQIALGSVTLDVPESWTVDSSNATGTPEQPGSWCVRSGGQCQLQVMVISAAQTLDNGFRLDQPYVIGDGNMCGSHGGPGSHVLTVEATKAVVGGQPAEYRAYTGACFTGSWEQWVVPTAPAVVISNPHVDPATENAVHYALEHAQLPDRVSSLWLGDYGLIRSATS